MAAPARGSGCSATPKQAPFQQEPRDPGVRKLIRYSKKNNKYLRRTASKISQQQESYLKIPVLLLNMTAF
jgi:hypothetical protein